MGQKLTVSARPHLEIEAHGTDRIELVEVLRYCKHDSAFKIIFSVNPTGPDFIWNDVDSTFNEDSIYYVRLRQSGLVRNRIPMAWSSPIWVKLKSPARP